MHRSLLSVPFCPRQVRSQVETLIEPAIDEVLDRVEGQSEVDLVAAVAQPFPFRVISLLMGLPIDDEPQMLARALKLLDYPWDPEGALRARREFSGHLKPVTQQRERKSTRLNSSHVGNSYDVIS